MSFTSVIRHFSSLFFFNDTATTEIYTLSLHDALPISNTQRTRAGRVHSAQGGGAQGGIAMRVELGAIAAVSSAALGRVRSEEHTSELQSRSDLVCRLLLEKKKQK